MWDHQIIFLTYRTIKFVFSSILMVQSFLEYSEIVLWDRQLLREITDNDLASRLELRTIDPSQKAPSPSSTQTHSISLDLMLVSCDVLSLTTKLELKITAANLI
jgi:hypothetical protein